MKKQLLIIFSLIILSLSFSFCCLILPLYKNSKNLIKHSKNLQANFLQTEQVADAEINLQIIQDLNSLNKNIQHFRSLSKLIFWDKKSTQDFALLDSYLQQATTLAEYFLTEEKSILVILQNSHEIRATGGFMGSYARINLSDGQLQDLYFNDIYEADGRFNGYQTPPAGVKEYLANGQSWRLPDSNWHPDFPTSSQKILQFFADCNETNVDLLIAMNLDFMEELLEITGPIYLPDYQLSISADNFAQVARSEREEFFPGTQQKKFFFTLFFNQLKFKLSKLDSQQQLAVLNLLFQQNQNKNLQFFSPETSIQKIFAQHNLTGAIYQIPDSNYLLFLESNVGINKANNKISRQVKLQLDKNSLKAQIYFDNQNLVPEKQMTYNRFIAKADHLAYVNYFRVVLDETAQLKNVKLDGQVITDIDEEIILNSQNQNFKQYGFLMVVEEQKQALLELEIEYQKTKPQLWIQKQAGLAETFYHLENQSEDLAQTLPQSTKIEFILKSDKLIQLQ